MQVSCRTTSEATILVLTRPDYNEMMSNYPEQQEIIASNILATFGLDSKGQALPGWTGDGRDDDEAFALLRQMVVEAVLAQLDNLQNQFTYAVNMGEVDTVKTLIRQGLDPNTSNYDHSRCVSPPAPCPLKRAFLTRRPPHPADPLSESKCVCVCVCVCVCWLLRGSMTHMAAVSGNVKVLEALLEEGADKDIVDRWGHTPLHSAFDSKNLLGLSVLNRYGASLNVSDPAQELCIAAAEEDIGQVRAQDRLRVVVCVCCCGIRADANAADPAKAKFRLMRRRCLSTGFSQPSLTSH